MRRLLPTLAALSLLAATPAAAQNFWDTHAAYVRGEYATALRDFRRLAGQGHTTAQYYLGLMYAEGHGVPQDHEEAVKWIRRAASWQGFANAQYSLGFMYANGYGLPRDYVQAYIWLSLAAEMGHETAIGYRSDIAAKMTPAQVAAAQRMARDRATKLKE